MKKTKNKRKLLFGILVIFSILICLSNVSAEDTSNLEIQDSSIDADLNAQVLSIDEVESISNRDDTSVAMPNSTNDYQNNHSDEDLEKSSSNNLQSSKLGKDISVGGSTFEDIQNAIHSAKYGDTIYLNGRGGIISTNTYYGSGTHIRIYKPLTIIGNSTFSNKHVTLDANRLSRIFYISANDVTLINIDFVNGQMEQDGGAIFWGASNGILKNCSFRSNSAHSTYDTDYGGGAVTFSPRFTNQYVENCVFTANSAYNGGAIVLGSSNSIVSNCTFDTNFGRTNERGAKANGAAILTNGINAKILNCNFFNNVAEEGSGGAFFIAPGSANINISDCNFTNNGAAYGGAIYWFDYASGNNIILNCYFEKNYAVSDIEASLGGAIYKTHNGRGSIINSTFIENSATTGSAIYTEGSLTVNNSTFKKNNADSEGAIAIMSDNVAIYNSSFDNNYAGRYGAAIYSWADCDKVIVDNSNFTNNHARRIGGAILFVGENCQISDSYFENNRVDDLMDGFGGAISIRNTGNSTSIFNCIFNKNSATRMGGAIYWMNDSYKNAVIANSNFLNNSAIYGGAVSVLAMGIIANSTFEYNSATFGGAIYIVNSLNLIADSTFKYNKAYSNELTQSVESYGIIFDFTGHENYMNAIRNNGNVNFKNVNYWDGSFVSSDSPIESLHEAGIDIKIIVMQGIKKVMEITKRTNINGQVIFDEYKTLPSGIYIYQAYHPEDDYYTRSNMIPGTLANSNYINNTLKIDVADAVYGEELLVNLSTNVSGNYTIFIANSSYDVTFSDDDVNKGNVLAYNVSVAQNELNGKVIHIPALIDVKEGYGAYVQFTNPQDSKNYVYSNNRTSFNVRIATSSLDANGTTIVNGSDAEINYTAVNGTVTITSIKKGSSILENGTDYTFAVSDGKVIVSGLDIGNYTVSLSTVVDKNHNPASKEVIVRVITQTRIDAPEELTLSYAGEDTINAQLDPSEAGTLSFTSNNESIVEVDNNGIIKAKAIGTTTIFISFAGNDDYTPSNATVRVTVIKNRLPTHIIVNESFNLNVNEQINMGATLDPSDAGNLTYASSNESVATVDEDGNIVAIAPGETKITLNFAGNDMYLPNSTEVLVTVHPVSDLSLSVDISNDEVDYGDIVELIIIVKNNGPNDATGVLVKNILPEGLIYVSDNITDADYVSTKNRLMASSSQNYDSSTGEWSIGDLGCGDETGISILAKANFIGAKELKSIATANEAKESTEFKAKLTADPVVDLEISLSVDKTELNVGDEATYTITVTNNGPNDASGVKVTDSQLAEHTFISASSDDYDADSGVWSIGDLSKGSSLELKVTVKFDNAGNYSNSAIISANEKDTNSSNDEASAEIVAVNEIENNTDDNNNTEPDNNNTNNNTNNNSEPDNNNTAPDNGSDVVNPTEDIEKQVGKDQPVLAKTGNPILLVLLAFAMIISTNLRRRRK